MEVSPPTHPAVRHLMIQRPGPGRFHWTAPKGVTSVQIECYSLVAGWCSRAMRVKPGTDYLIDFQLEPSLVHGSGGDAGCSNTVHYVGGGGVGSTNTIHYNGSSGSAGGGGPTDVR